MKRKSKIITIEVAGETFKLTPEEYAEWDKYQNKRPDLLGRIGYKQILEMFLTNYRLTHLLDKRQK